VAATETLNVQLVGGGEVSLIIEADFLSADLEDVCFIQRLAQLVRSYRSMPIKVSPSVVPTAAAKAPATSQPTTKPKATKKQAAATSRGSKYDYAEVARVACAAQRAGEPTARALAQRFKVSEAMGGQLVIEARRRGHDIPKRLPRPSTNVTPLLPVAEIEIDSHPASRAFTPADTLRIIEGG